MSRPLDIVPAGLIDLSDDMRILSANSTMGALVGRAPEELVGESIDIVLSAPSRILFQTHVFPALRAQSRVEEVFLTLASDSTETTPVLFNAVRDTESETPAYHGLMVRIRARSQWETDLLAAARAIERERAASQHLADELAATAAELAERQAERERNRQFRDAFIGVVSHELRTPITTIYGMSHVLRQRHTSMDDATLGQHLEDIEIESDRLRRLTEDLLVLSRAESGRLVLADDPIVISHVVEAAVASEQARTAGHHFSVQKTLGLPLVLGEELYVEQVVRNFLTNAVKYSPPGTTVSVTLTDEAGGVAVRVIDAGPGLGDEPPERLFELFYRSPDVVRQTAGAGIGLFVCRELVNAMGGRIWAAPAERGAEFGFWLPAATEDAADE